MQKFIDAGEPPLCVGFGSISDTKPELISATVLKAVKQSGERAIVLTGWGGLRQSQTQSDLPEMSENIFVTDQAPHSWLFPRCKAIVHHGGSGTSGAAFRSGMPSVVVPFFGDQPFWAEQANRLGVGLFIHRQDLSTQVLAAAIGRVCNDDTIRDAASALGGKIRTEHGAAAAASIFDECILKGPANL
jgi:sterol 3beta-glucosyltransferase